MDRVEDYVSSREEVEGTLKNFQEMISCVLSRRPHTRNLWGMGGFYLFYYGCVDRALLFPERTS